MCAYCSRRVNRSVCCSGQFHYRRHHRSFPLQFEINAGKTAENHQSTESKSIHTNTSDIFQRGCPGLAKACLFMPTYRQTAKQKQKFLFSNTSGGDLSPPPPTASLLHSLLYLSHNPLIKVQIKESLCSSLCPSISP